jgi:hypothetical protein
MKDKLIHYVVLFADFILEENYSDDIIKEMQDRYLFLMEEIYFWESIGEPFRDKRQDYALKSFLSWMYGHVAPRFGENGSIR